jgi:hypothetical protein
VEKMTTGAWKRALQFIIAILALLGVIKFLEK